MNNLDGLRADKLLEQLYNNLPQVKNIFTLQNDWLYFLVGTFVLLIVLKVIRGLLAIKNSVNETSILLELTPPSFTEKQSYTTHQLFSIIHSLGNQRSFKERLL